MMGASMADKNVISSLNEQLVILSQSINIDYLCLINANGEQRASAGAPGELSQADFDQLLLTHFKTPEILVLQGEVEEVRIIKHGMAECYVTPVNRSIQLLAMASIERPSILVRSMLTELLKARDLITKVVAREWKETDIKTNPEEKKTAVIKETKPATGDTLEALIENSSGAVKGKDASKFWDNATLEDQAQQQNNQTISFDEARRSGLVPEEKK